MIKLRLVIASAPWTARPYAATKWFWDASTYVLRSDLEVCLPVNGSRSAIVSGRFLMVPAWLGVSVAVHSLATDRRWHRYRGHRNRSVIRFCLTLYIVHWIPIHFLLSSSFWTSDRVHRLLGSSLGFPPSYSSNLSHKSVEIS